MGTVVRSVYSSLITGSFELECVVTCLSIVYLYKDKKQNLQVWLTFGVF